MIIDLTLIVIIGFIGAWLAEEFDLGYVWGYIVGGVTYWIV